MAPAQDGVSSHGSTEGRRAGHRLPLPCTGEPASTSRVLPGPGSSLVRSICTSADDEPEPEAAEGWSTKMLLATAAARERGRHYRRRPSSSSPTCDPLSSHGRADDRELRGGEDASSFVTTRLDEEQSSLPTRAFFLKPSTAPRNIKQQMPRKPSILEMKDAINWLPNVSEEEDETGDQKDWQTDHVSSCVSSDAINEWRLPDISEEKDETGDLKDWQTSPCTPSAFEWILVPDVGSNNHNASCLKPSAVPQNIKITLQKPRHPSLLGSVFTNECLKWYSSAASNTSARVPSGKDRASSAGRARKSSGFEDATKKEGYPSGVGYGDPHPPPFFKCEVCRKRTAFYRIKCCKLVVCLACGCQCDPDLDHVTQKEKLPKVKLVGTNLFLWQKFTFPPDLMLCMAKRMGGELKYYFATVEDMMNQRRSVISVTVFSFRQDGMRSVSKELLSRMQLQLQHVSKNSG